MLFGNQEGDSLKDYRPLPVFRKGDLWSLKEGNDTYAFMEQSVNDENVTHVLLLLDPQYKMKADARSGGVGTETQIISPEIYNKVKQEKFLPIVFERDDDGNIPKL